MIQDLQFYPLGDRALTIVIGKTINLTNYQKVLSLQKLIESLPLKGIIETVPAYCSLSIYYEPTLIKNQLPKANKSISQNLGDYLLSLIGNNQTAETIANKSSHLIEIPVCYDPEYGLDLEEIAAFHHTSADQIIYQHSAPVYTVFMLGFLPGFPYLGILPDSIAMPRKKHPRLKVAAGAVAIGGNQTGIYPIESPGGWNIIGQTPLKIFDKEKTNPFLLRAGDQVKFVPISKEDFKKYSTK